MSAAGSSQGSRTASQVGQGCVLLSVATMLPFSCQDNCVTVSVIAQAPWVSQKSVQGGMRAHNEIASMSCSAQVQTWQQCDVLRSSGGVRTFHWQRPQDN